MRKKQRQESEYRIGAFNEKFLRSRGRMPVEGQRIDWTERKTPGLVFRVTSNDARSWAVRYRPRGMLQKRETIGAYPGFGLKAARQRALEVIAAANRGDDLPAKEAHRRRLERGDARTVKDLVAEYIRDRCKPSQRRWQGTEALFEQHVIPQLGATRLVDLKRTDVTRLLDHLQNEKKLHAQVNRVRSQIIAALSWAVEERGYLTANPAVTVRRRKGLEAARDRALTSDELRAVWRAADELTDPARAFVKLLILTGQRRDEVRCLRWNEIDPGFKTWTLPAARNKGKRNHAVPLSGPAVEILKGLTRHEPFVFTVTGKTPYAGQKRLKEILDRESNVNGWRLHDLRRTCSSGLAELHVSQDVIDRVLNHAPPKLAATYNVHSYLEEKRAALDAWAARVTLIASGNLDQGSNVVALASSKTA